MTREDSRKTLVSRLADALNDHDLTRARAYLADDLHFIGVFGAPIEGAEAYPDAMGRLGARQTILKCMQNLTKWLTFTSFHCRRDQI